MMLQEVVANKALKMRDVNAQSARNCEKLTIKDGVRSNLY